jgi:hypothetical protein
MGWIDDAYDDYDPATAKLRKPRKRKSSIPDGLRDAHEGAAILNMTKDQFMAFVHDGAIRYVNVGRGTKRPRYGFTDADLQDFTENRKQQEIPQCQSLRQPSPRRTIGSTSKPVVVGFTALRNAQLSKKPRSSKP